MFDDQPLRGKRVALFRAEDQAATSEALLRERGAIPVLIPVLRIETLSSSESTAALGDLAAFSWIVFTSKNGADSAIELLEKAGKGPRELVTTKIAVIGEATAKALEERGIVATFVSRAGHGGGLGDELAKKERSKSRFLLLRAKVASPELASVLGDAGHEVTDVGVYETTIVPADSKLVDGADVLLFTSPSTVRGYLASNPQKLHSTGSSDDTAGRKKLIASIGPVTTRALHEADIAPDVEASPSTFPSLVSAVEAHLRRMNAPLVT